MSQPQHCDYGASITLRFKSDRKKAHLTLVFWLWRRQGTYLYPLYAAPGFQRFLQCAIFLIRDHKVETWGPNTPLVSILLANTMSFFFLSWVSSFSDQAWTLLTRHRPTNSDQFWLSQASVTLMVPPWTLNTIFANPALYIQRKKKKTKQHTSMKIPTRRRVTCQSETSLLDIRWRIN